MNNNIREQIGHALGALADGDFVVMARDLLAVLGYESTRTLDISGRVNEFIAQFPAPTENTQTEQVFCENAQSVRILFQVTDTEIAAQNTLFDTGDFDRGNARSFLFAAVELNGKTYSRGQYAQFTREINKRINMPTVVLFMDRYRPLDPILCSPPRTQARFQPRCARPCVADPRDRSHQAASRSLRYFVRFIATATLGVDERPRQAAQF